MNKNDMFGWGTPEVTGYESMHDKKRCVRLGVSEGVFNGNAWESFRTNDDNAMIPQVGGVLGENPMSLFFGKGLIPYGTLIPEDYDIISDPESIPTTDTETVKIAIQNNEVANAMTGTNYFEDIILTQAEINNSINLFATENVTIDGISVVGDKGASNGKVNYSAKEVTIKNMNMGDDPNTTVYNMFEGNQDTTKPGLEVMNIENVTILNPNLTHNVANIYTPASGAKVIVKDCQFDLNVNNSNVLRLSNYLNASNVTVEFENVEWNYENGSPEGSNWDYAGLVIYQAVGADHAFAGDYTELKTWKFSFKNCKYNGEKVNANNFGEHNQVLYMYGLNGSNVATNPADIEGLTVTFE